MALSYKCGTYCSYGDVATGTLFKQLQTVVNQFSAVAGFTPIGVDGLIGKQTLEAALIALVFLEDANVSGISGSAFSIEDSISSIDQLAANAQIVTDLLTLAVKSGLVGATVVAVAPAVVGTSPGISTALTTSANSSVQTTSPAAAAKVAALQAKKPALKRSLLDRMPPWAAYAGGIALITGTIAAIAIAGKRKKAGKPAIPSPAPLISTAMAGWRSRRFSQHY